MPMTEVFRKTRRWSAVAALSAFVGLAGAASANTQPMQPT
ncbi:collagenase [Burkholderia pseudomallei]|nr:collagenase [Burkholderia pseudomallei]